MALKSDKFGLIVTGEKTEWSDALKEWVEISDDIEAVRKILRQSFTLQKKTFNYQQKESRSNQKTKTNKTKKETLSYERTNSKVAPITKVKWYKRILNKITLGNKDNHKWNKKQDKKLRDIKNKPTGSKGISKLLGGILLGVTLLSGKLAKGLLARAMFGMGGGMVLRGANALFGSDKKAKESNVKNEKKGLWGKSLSKVTGSKLLRKIPFLGALLAGGSIATSELLSNKTRSEKNKVIGGQVGSFGGATAGMVAGATIGSVVPVVGTIVGGLVGAWFGSDAGKILGEKASEFFDSDVWESIKDLHTKAVDLMSKGFELASKGIDNVKELHEGAVNVTSNVMTFFGNARQKAINAVSDGMSSVSKTYDTARTRKRKKVLLDEARKQGITDPKELSVFMGQMGHESASFKSMGENLNYSPERLLKVFKGRGGINTLADAKRVVAGGESSIAEAIYGGKWGAKKLGNTKKGDGLRFKGRGFTGLTGRDNYERAGKAIGVDLIKNPQLASEPSIASKIAVNYWKTRVRKSDRTNVRASTKSINGGYNGLSDRSMRAKRWERELTQTASIKPKIVTPNMPQIKPLTMPPPKKVVSTRDDSKVTNSVIHQEAGRDVPDRQIAHAITGGVSS